MAFNVHTLFLASNLWLIQIKQNDYTNKQNK